MVNYTLEVNTITKAVIILKFNFNRKYTTIAVYSIIVLIVAVLFVVFVFRFESFAKGFSWVGAVAAPVICGIIIAYILNPLMMFIENKLFGKLKNSPPAEKKPALKNIENDIEKKLRRKNPADREVKRRKSAARILSILVTYIILLAVITGITVAVVPSVVTSVVDLAEKLPGYLEQAETFLNDFFKDNPQISQFLFEEFTDISNELKKFAEKLEPMQGDILGNVGSGIWNFALSVITGLKNFLLGFIIAIYLLYSKERLLAQSKKIIFAFFNNERCERFFSGLNKSNDIFKKYIISNLVDSMIVFIFMVIGMFAMGMPYQMLISAICAVTNLIPFFGPFIGAIPSGILILLVDPSKVIWFAVFVLILQQCDGNIIKPFLFGETMGLPAIWVLVSIIIGGGLFQIPGMLLGAPVFAVIYLLFAEFVSGKLKRKNLPSETEVYFKGAAEFASEYIDAPPNNTASTADENAAEEQIAEPKPKEAKKRR